MKPKAETLKRPIQLNEPLAWLKKKIGILLSEIQEGIFTKNNYIARSEGIESGNVRLFST